MKTEFVCDWGCSCDWCQLLQPLKSFIGVFSLTHPSLYPVNASVVVFFPFVHQRLLVITDRDVGGKRASGVLLHFLSTLGADALFFLVSLHKEELGDLEAQVHQLCFDRCGTPYPPKPTRGWWSERCGGASVPESWPIDAKLYKSARRVWDSRMQLFDLEFSELKAAAKEKDELKRRAVELEADNEEYRMLNRNASDALQACMGKIDRATIKVRERMQEISALKLKIEKLEGEAVAREDSRRRYHKKARYFYEQAVGLGYEQAVV